MLIYPQMTTHADPLKSMMKLEEIHSLDADIVALTNTNLKDSYSFWRSLTERNRHPVLGLSVPVLLSNRQSFLFLYAQNNNGWKNLMKLSSAIETMSINTIKLSWLRVYSRDCYVLLPNAEDFQKEELDELLQFVPKSNLIGGLSRTNGKKSLNENDYRSIFENHQLPIVATQEIKYLNPSDSLSYDVLRAIETGSKLKDLRRSEPLFFAPREDEWKEWFLDSQELLSNAERIFSSCHVDLSSPVTQMPVYPEQLDFKELCVDGLRNRIGSIPKRYEERLEKEISIIKQMRYEDYFLVVADFMKFAKDNFINTGPGRGSSASSLVAFSLFITDIDPLKYDLLFERFLNPDRVSLPDIDIDFEDRRRKEVVEYIFDKYGKDHVAQISTSGTLTAKAVARDVGRVFGFSMTEMNKISSMIPDIPNITLKGAYERQQNFKRYANEHKEWFDVACRLEGLTRNASTHAAGIVLSPTPIVETVPLTTGADGMYATQWVMEDVEKSGLIKIDLLSLKNLTLLNDIRQHVDVPLEHHDILHDGPTIDIFKYGHTLGIFQFESTGMQNSLRTVKPNRFEDVVAINALYRPGPMAYIEEYSLRKNNNKSFQYPDNSMKPILDETYGIIVYQEQLMQVVSAVAGYTFAEADLLRRAISKKNRDILQQEYETFLCKSKEKGMDNQKASVIYGDIVKFADYGFPKSHAVAYTTIAFQLAFLKARYPCAFYAELLNHSKGSDKKISAILEEMKFRKIPIYPPDITRSQLYTEPFEDGVLLGLDFIKGVTKSVKNLIIQNQSKGWKDMSELAFDLALKNFDAKNIVPLIHSGALDSLPGSRDTKIKSIPVVTTFLEFHQVEGNEPITYTEALMLGRPRYAEGKEDTQVEVLEQQLSSLGFYLSGHPATFKKEYMKFNGFSIASCHTFHKGKPVYIIGSIERIRKIQTKNKEAMAFATVQDETGSISCTLFPRELEVYKEGFKEKEIVAIYGSIEIRNDERQIIIKKIETL